MKSKIIACLTLACLATTATLVTGDDDDAANENDQELAADLALLQGSWELLHGNPGKAPKILSVKTIEGNTETLRRYDIKTGELKHQHSVEFQLSKSGNVRVFTFYPPGGSPKNGLSYVYKLDKNDFFDIPGLLHGDRYRNYQPSPKLWHWKRVVEKEKEADRTPKPNEPERTL